MLHLHKEIYFHNEDGVTTVIEDGRNFKLVSKNKLDGKLMSSAAVSEGAIFMRSDTALYKIENK